CASVGLVSCPAIWYATPSFACTWVSSFFCCAVVSAASVEPVVGVALPDALAEPLALADGVGEALLDALALALGVADALAFAEAEALPLGLGDADLLALGLGDADAWLVSCTELT